MDSVQPTLKHISAVDWDGAPLVSEAPIAVDCQLEIGASGEDFVDYFTLTVVNRAWAEAHLAAVPDAAPAWLPPRAILLADAPSFQAIEDCLTREMATMGPYRTWPEFANRLGPYLRWELEGVPYPPFV